MPLPALELPPNSGPLFKPSGILCPATVVVVAAVGFGKACFATAFTFPFDTRLSEDVVGDGADDDDGVGGWGSDA